MVLDSSAIVAIHLRETGHERLIDRIDAAEVVVVGVPTLVETAMVLTARLGQDARPMIALFCAAWKLRWYRSTRNTWTPPQPHSSGSGVAVTPPV